MDLYKICNLRPYKKFNVFKLLRLKSFLVLCNFPKAVKNLNSAYHYSSRFIGRNNTNNFIKYMIGDLLTGGSTFEELEKTLINVDKDGFSSSISYCRECLNEESENKADLIIDVNIKCIDYAVKINSSNTTSLKISSLCDIEKLKLYNKIQVILTTIDFGLNNQLPLEEINKQIVNSDIKVTLDEENFNFLRSKKSILGLNLMEMFANFSSDDLKELNKIFNVKYEIIDYGKVTFYTRLNKILSYAKEKKCSVLYDAEQSYVQKMLDSSGFYFASVFNKDFTIILQTVQCYLKDCPQKIDSYISFFRENNLKLGLKLVRGAYLSEEIKLASELGYPKLNCDTIEDTHHNFNNMMRKLVSVYKEGDKIIFATHNADSVLQLMDLLGSKSSLYKEIYSAQLFGISEHVTSLSKISGLKTMRHISFGEIEIMVPWLIRRAEETSLITKLKPQTFIVNHEIKLRFKKPAVFISFFIVASILF